MTENETAMVRIGLDMGTDDTKNFYSTFDNVISPLSTSNAFRSTFQKVNFHLIGIQNTETDSGNCASRTERLAFEFCAPAAAARRRRRNAAFVLPFEKSRTRAARSRLSPFLLLNVF
ncbi:hypothetical protein EVAR_62939_1 [Eumeta japonica]|uniref:Uncharacterized protein n=1 Tax=Eumeta variegata TaxID=151549 RepID=A0A4C1ZCN2_EUMVA|nr:hypothetical protein EVAR_62939_1 [Eumeta japonica]